MQADDPRSMADSERVDGRDETLRRARRAVAKATHPDRGGDPDTHRRAMEALGSLGPDLSLAGAARRRIRDLAKLPSEVRKAYREGRDEEISSGPTDAD